MSNMWGFPWWEGQGAILHSFKKGRLVQILVNRLPTAATACQNNRMRVVFVFQRMLCVLALLGVMFGPVSVGVAESAMASSGSISMSDPMPDMQMPSAEMERAAVADGMPCCPKAQPVVPDCQKNCPLALICASMVLAHPPQAPFTKAAFPWTISFPVMPEDNLASTVIEPPARPPRA